jgi:hypothetical protein
MYDAVGMHRVPRINTLRITEVPQDVDEVEEIDNYNVDGGVGPIGIASTTLRY